MKVAVHKIPSDKYAIPEITDKFLQLSVKKVDNSLPSPVMTVLPMSTAECKPCYKKRSTTTATPSSGSIP